MRCLHPNFGADQPAADPHEVTIPLTGLKKDAPLSVYFTKTVEFFLTLQLTEPPTTGGPFLANRQEMGKQKEGRGR